MNKCEELRTAAKAMFDDIQHQEGEGVVNAMEEAVKEEEQQESAAPLSRAEAF